MPGPEPPHLESSSELPKVEKPEQDAAETYTDLIEHGASTGKIETPEPEKPAATAAEPAKFPHSLEEVRIWDELGRHYPTPNAGIWIGNLYPDWHFGLLLEIARVPIRFLSGGRWILLKESQRQVDQEFLKFLTTNGLRPIRLIPRVREAGAFVYFPSVSMADRALLVLQQQQRQYTARRIRGDPFYEDLYFRPSKKIKMSNVAGKKVIMTQEEVFNLVRNYGRLRECTSDGTSAEAVFISSASAIAARNCLQGLQLTEEQGGGTLVITFQEYSQWKQFNALWEYLKSPRLLPLIALALAFCLLAMIEPFRLVNVAQTLAIKRSTRESTDRTEFDSFLPFYPVDCPIVNDIKKQFTKPPNGIIVIQGPKGTGKTRLIKDICQRRAYSLRVDCSPDSQNDATTIETFVATLESTVGFKPSFRFINSMLAFAESFLPKGNHLTQTSTVALNKVLLGLQRSLTFMQMTAGRSTSYVYPVIVFDSFPELVDYINEKNPSQNTSQMLHNVLDWSVLISQHFQSAHVVFVTDTNVPGDHIASHQAAQTKIRCYSIPDLTEEQAIAFITDNVNPVEYETSATLASEDASEIEGSTRNRVIDEETVEPVEKTSWFSTFRTVVTTGWRRTEVPEPQTVERPVDWNSESTVQKDLSAQIQAAVTVLGGRLSDLSSFVTRVNDGASMNAAIRAMLKDQRGTVLRVGFANHPHDHGLVGKKWTNFQLWQCVDAIVKSSTNSISETTIINSFFEGDTVPYYALLKTGLLERVERSSGHVVRAGSPLLLTVFTSLTKTEDRLVFEKMRLNALVEKARKKLTAAEEEFRLISPGGQSEALFTGFEEIVMRRKRVAADIAKYSARLVTAEDSLDAFNEAVKRGEMPK